MSKLKICKECGKLKAQSERHFYKNSQMRDGLFSRCKKCVNAYDKRRREEDPDRHAARIHQWCQTHKEQWSVIASRSEAKRVRDPMKKRIYNANYRARKQDAFIEAVDPQVLWERDEGVCGICDKAIRGDFEVDHIIPLALDGEHSYANTQIAHPLCNHQKGARFSSGDPHPTETFDAALR